MIKHCLFAVWHLSVSSMKAHCTSHGTPIPHMMCCQARQNLSCIRLQNAVWHVMELHVCKMLEEHAADSFIRYIFQGSETAWHPAPALSNTKHKKDGQGTAGTQRHRQKAAHLTNATEGSFMAVCAVVKDQPDRIGQPGGMVRDGSKAWLCHLCLNICKLKR